MIYKATLPCRKPVATASVSLNNVQEIQVTWQSCLVLPLQLTVLAAGHEIFLAGSDAEVFALPGCGAA